MATSDAADTYKILIDGDWTLEDLSVYPRLFEQVYLAIHAFGEDVPSSPIRTFGGLDGIADGGGYATVNLYRHLSRISPRQRRISVKSIQYASPGWIEIIADAELVGKVAISVGSIAGAIMACHQAYMAIRKGTLEIRKRQRDERRELFDFRKEELQYLHDSAVKLDNIMKLDSFQRVQDLTQDTDATLQLYLGLYRRVEKLAEYDVDGKAKLPKE